MSSKQLTFEQNLAKTQRLNLRALSVIDAVRLFDYRNQPEVSIFQGWTPVSPKQVSDYALQMRTREVTAPGHWFQIVVELKSSELSPSLPSSTSTKSAPIIGDVAFCIDTETRQQAELGVALDTQFQRQGYATEALTALIDLLFASFSLHRIHVSIDPRNKSSLTLFQRLGFRKEGHLIQSVYFKDQWCDDIIMAVLQSEWSERRKMNLSD